MALCTQILTKTIGYRVVFLLVLLALAGCQGQRLIEPEPCQRANPIVVSREAATRLQNKLLANFGEDAPAHFRLSTDDVEVTSYLTIQTAGSNLDVPQVWFIPGRVCITGALLVIGPLRTTFTVRVLAGIEDRRARVHFEYLRWGGWVLPATVSGLLSRIANETLQDARPDFEITELDIEPNRLLIAGTRRSQS